MEFYWLFTLFLYTTSWYSVDAETDSTRSIVGAVEKLP